MLEQLRLANFSARVGQRFRIEPEASPHLEVELIAATDLTSPGAPQDAPARAPFSIVFRGPRGAVLPQRIYRVEHDEVGSFELFLVTIGPDGEGMRYEAIFT